MSADPGPPKWPALFAAFNLVLCFSGTVSHGSLQKAELQLSTTSSSSTVQHTVFDSLQHPSSMLESLEPDFPRVVILRGAGGKAFSGGVDIKVRVPHNDSGGHPERSWGQGLQWPGG